MDIRIRAILPLFDHCFHDVNFGSVLNTTNVKRKYSKEKRKIPKLGTNRRNKQKEEHNCKICSLTFELHNNPRLDIVHFTNLHIILL